MEIFNNFLVQLGFAGLTVAGLIWFVKYLFVYVMESTRRTFQEKEKLELEFRDYLIRTTKEQHSVIEKNTEVFSRIVEILETSFARYMLEKNNAQKELTDEIRNLVKVIK